MTILFIICAVSAMAAIFYRLGYEKGEDAGYINAMNDGWGGNVNE
jgi:hypothetical protein